MEKLIIPSILSVSDVISMTERILHITQPISGIDTKFLMLYIQTSQIFERLVWNQKKTSKSSLTEDLILADKSRDCAFICLRDILHGMSVSILDDIRKPAAKLYAIFEKYGLKIYSLGYKAESALLLSLQKEFNQPENQQLLNQLGIIQFYESLKTAEENFGSINKQKTEEKTEQSTHSEAATEIQNEIVPVLTNLVAMLQLYSQLDMNTYKTICDQVITSITEINAVARARKTRKQNSTGPKDKAGQA